MAISLAFTFQFTSFVEQIKGIPQHIYLLLGACKKILNSTPLVFVLICSQGTAPKLWDQL
jgi:hypothetical protein